MFGCEPEQSDSLSNSSAVTDCGSCAGGNAFGSAGCGRGESIGLSTSCGVPLQSQSTSLRDFGDESVWVALEAVACGEVGRKVQSSPSGSAAGVFVARQPSAPSGRVASRGPAAGFASIVDFVACADAGLRSKGS